MLHYTIFRSVKHNLPRTSLKSFRKNLESIISLQNNVCVQLVASHCAKLTLLALHTLYFPTAELRNTKFEIRKLHRKSA
jgi:hypothetical protein